MSDDIDGPVDAPIDPARIAELVAEGYELMGQRADTRQRADALLADRQLDEAVVLKEGQTDDPDDEKPKRSQASLMVDLATEAGWNFWHDERKKPWASILVGEGDSRHLENCRLDDEGVGQHLGRLFWRDKGGVPSAQAVKDATRALAGRAMYEGECHTTYVRVAGAGDAVYHDLGDDMWRAVKITADKWEIVSDVPVKFRRPASSMPLSDPVHGGSLAQLTDLINISDASDRMLVTAFLVGAMRHTGPFPILHLQGQQGAAKTMTARLMKRVIDPTVGDMRKAPTKTDDLVVGARSSWLLAFDNLSGLSNDLSDDLCRLATGGALSKRTHYTDEDEHVIDVMRPVMLTGIDDLAGRGDLTSRSIFVRLPVIEGAARKTEEEINARFDAALPGVLGALYDAVQCALANLRAVKIDNLPRLADFGRWVTAAEGALGWESGSFLAAYADNAHEAALATIESSPIAEFLIALVGFSGPAGELLEQVNRLAKKKDSDPTGSRYWPRKPRSMSNAVERIAPALRADGVQVSRSRSHGVSVITITREIEAAPESLVHPILNTPGALGALRNVDANFSHYEKKGELAVTSADTEADARDGYIESAWPVLSAPSAPLNTTTGALGAPDACPRCGTVGRWLYSQGRRRCKGCIHGAPALVV